MSKPTIQDVAKLAGVGVGTVSRVLNNHVAVKSTTRQQVLEAIKTLQYTPNPHARRIAGGKSYTISVLLPVVTTEFYVRLLDGLESAFQEARYDVALFPLLDKARLERYLGSHTLAYQADGLVMATYNLSEMMAQNRLQSSQPLVLVDAQAPHIDCAYMDNHLGGVLAGDFLSQQAGNIYAIWVETELDQVFSSRVFDDRRAGLKQSLQAHQRQLTGEYVTSFDAYAARSQAKQVLDEITLPASIFASADLLAAALLDEAAERGLKVGQELKMLGFDDQPWAAQRGLSTLHQPVEAMGYEAATLLLSRLGGYKGTARAKSFEPVLILRASTGH